jgi:amicyanin
VARETVVIKDMSFSPAQLTVKVGTAVTWTNEDSFLHSVLMETGPQTFASNNLRTNDKFTFTFTQVGTYDYSCGVHPSMRGTVIVTE